MAKSDGDWGENVLIRAMVHVGGTTMNMPNNMSI